MKAAFILKNGGPEAVEVGDFPKPKPGPGQALVRVKASALNHLDVWVCGGSPAYRVPLPHVLGSDLSGEVAEIGPNTELPHGVEIGSAVCVAPGISCWNCPQCLAGQDNQCASFKIIGAMTQGGHAEYAVVPVRNLISKPLMLSFEEAASFPLVFLTAWHMLITRAALKPGETVLVVGAGSGVSSAAIQIARAAGARVIAVSSSTEKLERARALGADHGVDGSKEDFGAAAMKLTGGRGVDVVFEHVGPATWEQSFKALARCGRLVTCGATTGPMVQLDLRFMFSKDLSVLGARMGTRAELEKIVSLMESGRLKPVVGRVFPLDEARKAYEFLEAREQFGKVVLKVS